MKKYDRHNNPQILKDIEEIKRREKAITGDVIVQRVMEDYNKRSKAGIEKYGTTLEREDLNLLEWLQHFQEELMDATLYVEKIKVMEQTRTMRPCDRCGGFNYLEHPAAPTICSVCQKDDYSDDVQKFKTKYNVSDKDLKQFIDTIRTVKLTNKQ